MYTFENDFASRVIYYNIIVFAMQYEQIKPSNEINSYRSENYPFKSELVYITS